jgi:hypothetical protein
MIILSPSSLAADFSLTENDTPKSHSGVSFSVVPHTSNGEYALIVPIERAALFARQLFAGDRARE